MKYNVNTQELPRIGKNNDPLAHVYLLLDSYNGELAEHRIYQEFITDIGERLPGQPFRREFVFNLHNGQLVSDTGLNMHHFLQTGYEAAVADYNNGTQPHYAVARAEALLQQGTYVEEWVNSESNDDVIFYSLCPTDNEISVDDAKRQNFKPDRMMASVQRYSKTDGHIVMEAYSLDGMHLDDIATLHGLDAQRDVANTTLEQLLRGITVHSDTSTDSIIRDYDTLTSDKQSSSVYYTQGVDMTEFKQEANRAVEACPDAWNLYISTVREVASSLRNGTVTDALVAIVTQQATGFIERELLLPDYLRITKGQQYTFDNAAELLNHLRKEAIPHYIVTSWNDNTTRSSSGGMSFSGAGADSVASGTSYEGACPTSGAVTTLSQEVSALNDVFGKQNKNILACVTCPFCRHSVDAKLTATTISCPRVECGAILDLKTNERIDKKLQNSQPINDAQKIVSKEENNAREIAVKNNTSAQIANIQDDIWVLQFKLFNTQVTEEEKVVLYAELFTLTEAKNALLRQKN